MVNLRKMLGLRFFRTHESFEGQNGESPKDKCTWRWSQMAKIPGTLIFFQETKELMIKAISESP